MKLRIKDNGLRFRCTQSEVNRLAHGEIVASSIEFGPESHLGFQLSSSQAISAPSVTFERNVICVNVPQAMVIHWHGTDQIGIEIQHMCDGAGLLTVIIEKDFVCLQRRSNGDDDDAFPNPNAYATA